jgi:thiol-disulfide isomerase/thioredoxin
VSARRVFWAFCIGTLLGCVVTAQAEIRVGDSFPTLAEQGLSGGELPSLKGKVALVDFWASWCAPCKASFPAFDRLNAEFASRGLVILAISVDEKPAAFTAFVKKYQPPFATLLDGGHKLVEALRVPAMPTSYLIGRDGRVRFLHAGFHGTATEQELHSQIETLLAENADPKS